MSLFASLFFIIALKSDGTWVQLSTQLLDYQNMTPLVRLALSDYMFKYQIKDPENLASTIQLLLWHVYLLAWNENENERIDSNF